MAIKRFTWPSDANDATRPASNSPPCIALLVAMLSCILISVAGCDSAESTVNEPSSNEELEMMTKMMEANTQAEMNSADESDE
ncbi:MAG: hypothetical protein AAF539_07010 [Planctomycetota bacterium]